MQMFCERNSVKSNIHSEIKYEYIRRLIWHLCQHQLLYFAFVGVNIHVQKGSVMQIFDTFHIHSIGYLCLLLYIVYLMEIYPKKIT